MRPVVTGLPLLVGLALWGTSPAWSGEEEQGSAFGGFSQGSPQTGAECAQPGGSCEPAALPEAERNVGAVMETLSCDLRAPRIAAMSGRGECRAFFAGDSGGQCGKYGQLVYDTIRDEFGPESRFYADDLTDFSRVCPNWRSLTRDQKTEFWVMVLAGMAAGESDCRDGLRARGPHGGLIGLYQMPSRGASWRGRFCGGSMKDWRNNTKCTLTILHEQLKGERYDGDYRGRGALVQSSSTYWDVLQPHGVRYPVSRAFYKSYAPCGKQQLPEPVKKRKKKRSKSRRR